MNYIENLRSSDPRQFYKLLKPESSPVLVTSEQLRDHFSSLFVGSDCEINNPEVV